MKLAVIGEVAQTIAIEGADKIQSVVVNCGTAGRWTGVAGKEMGVGQRVTVFLQDALLPPDPRWAFMERKKWRVKMARFLGVPSECLVIGEAFEGEIGDDLSERLGVVKYEKPIPAQMNGEAVAEFPSFLIKSDEANFQTVDVPALMSSSAWYVTEKADGSSCTAWVDEQGLHVCSRNWELAEFNPEGKSNMFWETARRYGLDQLSVGVALQFEVVGNGVQSNRMKLEGVQARVFAVFDRAKMDGVGKWGKVPYAQYDQYIPAGMPKSKLIKEGTGVLNADELRKLAEIEYVKGTAGEGVVIRAVDQSWSFKVINLLYKD